MEMRIGTHFSQDRTFDHLLWIAGVLIGTAFLWPLFFAVYLWAVYAGKL